MTNNEDNPLRQKIIELFATTSISHSKYNLLIVVQEFKQFDT